MKAVNQSIMKKIEYLLFSPFNKVDMIMMLKNEPFQRRTKKDNIVISSCKMNPSEKYRQEFLRIQVLIKSKVSKSFILKITSFTLAFY